MTHIISIVGNPPSIVAHVERPQPVGWLERVVCFIFRRDIPVREERWVSQGGIFWFRESDGIKAPDQLRRVLEWHRISDETLKKSRQVS